MPHKQREEHKWWKGGKRCDSYGYVKILRRGHPRADTANYVRETILISEKILGKPLPGFTNEQIALVTNNLASIKAYSHLNLETKRKIINDNR